MFQRVGEGRDRLERQKIDRKEKKRVYVAKKDEDLDNDVDYYYPEHDPTS